VRSELTQKVSFDKGEKLIRDKIFSEELSGQLPDLGSMGGWHGRTHMGVRSRSSKRMV
jgi:hypothetical protein